MEGPDGYTNEADLWVAMERRKCETGLMQSFFVEREGEICGTVGMIIQADRLARLKNIVIAPPHRRTGLGVAAVGLLRQLAARDHGLRLGVLGVQGGHGSKLYRRAGLSEVTCQFEWSRPHPRLGIQR